MRSGICAAAADAKGFRVAARGQKKKTRTGTGTPTRFGRWGRARFAVRRAARAGPWTMQMISSFIYLPFAFGPIRCITCCSCRTLLVFGFRSAARAPSSSSSSPSTTEPTTACRRTTDGRPGVPRNCSDNNIILLLFTFCIFYYYYYFRRHETRRRALLSIVVCWLHWCWPETLPTSAVMTLSSVSRRRRRSAGPVCAADTNRCTQCADRTIATDESLPIFRTGCSDLQTARQFTGFSIGNDSRENVSIFAERSSRARCLSDRRILFLFRLLSTGA